jgi:hypothetical protein
MTLAARNFVLYTGITLSFLLLCGFGFVGYTLITGNISDQPLDVPNEQIWFGRHLLVPDSGVYYSLASAGVLGVISVTGVLVAARVFRRLSSAEVFFFTVFMMSLSLELLRIGQLPLIATEQPPVYGTLLSRAILFGRLFGYLVLFASGIYAAGAQYPRVGTLTLLLATLAFLVVYFVPVDLLWMNATLVHRVGGRESVDAVLAFLSLATIANYAYAWATGRTDRGFMLFSSVVLLVVGRELSFNVPGIATSAVGVALVAAGAVGYMATTRSHYLWY